MHRPSPSGSIETNLRNLKEGRYRDAALGPGPKQGPDEQGLESGIEERDGGYLQLSLGDKLKDGRRLSAPCVCARTTQPDKRYSTGEKHLVVHLRQADNIEDGFPVSMRDAEALVGTFSETRFTSYVNSHKLCMK